MHIPNCEITHLLLVIFLLYYVLLHKMPGNSTKSHALVLLKSIALQYNLCRIQHLLLAIFLDYLYFHGLSFLIGKRQNIGTYKSN